MNAHENGIVCGIDTHSCASETPLIPHTGCVNAHENNRVYDCRSTGVLRPVIHKYGFHIRERVHSVVEKIERKNTLMNRMEELIRRNDSHVVSNNTKETLLTPGNTVTTKETLLRRWKFMIAYRSCQQSSPPGCA